MDNPCKTPEQLRSYRWYQQYPPGPASAFGARSRTLQNGYALSEFSGKPVIGIINTWSDLSTCHGHLRERAEVVKRGVWQAGGFPVELGTFSLGEVIVKPSSMMYRNFLAMEVEELIRSHPIDGVVLMGGCDKTTPGLLMGTLSMDVPAIYIPAGFMLSGHWKGEKLGSGTSIWKLRDDLIAGNLEIEDWLEVEQRSARSVGTCNTMGTASTMTSIAETLGLTLPGASSIPAVDAEHSRLASAAGRRIVDMVWEDLKISAIVDRHAVDNALTVTLALGGSTNAVIHLLAIAHRAGVDLTLEDFDQRAFEIPVLANLQPAGEFLMEEFYVAGGLPALLKRLASQLHLNAPTVTGKSLGENIASAEVHDETVIRDLATPIAREALAVLRGNLAPDGALIKPSAATPALLRHRGPALVFDNINAMQAVINSDDLEVDENTVIVLRNCGPQGAPGMPEWGMLPIPKKLLKKGIRDIVRISDARMSGTSYGTCVLHVTPEAHIGGPLALVQTGDPIDLDVGARRIHLDVDETVLAERRNAWQPPAPYFERGYGAIFLNHIQQANVGCDFDILNRNAATPEPQV